MHSQWNWHENFFEYRAIVEGFKTRLGGLTFGALWRDNRPTTRTKRGRKTHLDDLANDFLFSACEALVVESIKKERGWGNMHDVLNDGLQTSQYTRYGSLYCFVPFRLIDQRSYRRICGKLVAESLGQGQMLEGCTSLALWYLVENGGQIEFQMTYNTGKLNTKQQCMYKGYIFLH